MTSAKGPLPLSIKLSHGLGSVALGVKEAGLTTFFMIYYNQVLGFDPRIVSLVLIGAMFVDALVDPLIGRLSDATRSRFGRRLPWLYIAPLPMALAWTLLWISPDVMAHSITGLALNVIAVRLLVSACEIPSISLVAELTRDYDERTTLMRFRFLFGWIGGLLTTALAYGYFLRSSDPDTNGLLDPAGYGAFGLFGAAMIFVSTIGSALGQHRHIVAQPQPAAAQQHGSMLADIALAFRNPAFVALASGALFVIASYATSIAATNYLMLYVWRLTDSQLSWYPAGLAVAVFGAFLVVGRAHRRFGKRDTAIATIVLSAVIGFLPYTARNIGWWPELGGWASVVLLLSFMTVALLGQVSASISTASMVAEIVEDHESRHGTRIEGVFFAGYLMVQKLGHALGIFLVGQLVAFAGLHDRMKPEELAPETATAMAWLFALMMMILAAAAGLLLRRYGIDRAGHEARLASLNRSAGEGIGSDDGPR